MRLYWRPILLNVLTIRAEFDVLGNKPLLLIGAVIAPCAQPLYETMEQRSPMLVLQLLFMIGESYPELCVQRTDVVEDYFVFARESAARSLGFSPMYSSFMYAVHIPPSGSRT